MSGERASEIAAMTRQQKRAAHREAEKRGKRLPPMSSFEERAYRLAGELKVTDVWALSGLDQVERP